ncbi:MAG: hypothetical protein M3O88_03150, partial [Actinomycetota bacterium]|nr:hypothetical protein [Actinomycetota bacterium]
MRPRSGGGPAAPALMALGRISADLAEVSRPENLLREALGLFEVAGDAQGRAWTLQRLSEAARFRGLKEQVELLRHALALLEDVGDAGGRSTVALDLAVLQQARQVLRRKARGSRGRSCASPAGLGRDTSLSVRPAIRGDGPASHGAGSGRSDPRGDRGLGGDGGCGPHRSGAGDLARARRSSLG